MFVFVYGTLKQGHGNSRLMDGAIVSVSPAVVSGYTLFDTGIPYAVPARGFRIVGELVEIDREKAPGVLKRLDALEGHPRHYARTPVEATRQNDGTPFAAFMYVVVGEPHGTHIGESWPREPISDTTRRVREEIDKVLSPREENRRSRFAWACVASPSDKAPSDVADVWVVKVIEEPGHIGPVTWNRRNGQTFSQVLGPVRNYRSEARADRKAYLKAHRLTNFQREANYT